MAPPKYAVNLSGYGILERINRSRLAPVLFPEARQPQAGSHGAPTVSADRLCHDSRPPPLSVSSPYHPTPARALGHHTRPPRHSAWARPVARVRPVGRVASQPKHPVRSHNTMNVGGSLQSLDLISLLLSLQGSRFLDIQPAQFLSSLPSPKREEFHPSPFPSPQETKGRVATARSVCGARGCRR